MGLSEGFGGFGESLGTLECLWEVLEGLWALFGHSLVVFGGSFGVFGGPLGGLWEVFGGLWGGLWVALGSLGDQVQRNIFILTSFWLHFGVFGRSKATLEDTKSDVEPKKSLLANSYFDCRILIKN